MLLTLLSRETRGDANRQTYANADGYVVHPTPIATPMATPTAILPQAA